MSLAASIAERIVQKEKLFFLLGAGASISAGIPPDVPTSEGLGWTLALSETGNPDVARERFGEEICLKDLLLGVDKAQFRQLLLKQNWWALEPTRCHDVIARLMLEGYHIDLATINYDPLCEIAFRRLGHKAKVFCSRETIACLREDGPLVLKIHGCPYTDQNPDNLLVTEEDLRVGRPWIENMVRSRIQERHCIYVGFSCNVDYIVTSVDSVVKDIGVEVLSTFIIDIKSSEEVFGAESTLPLTQFTKSLGLEREQYCSAEADDFFAQLGDSTTRLILATQLDLAINEANEIRPFSGEIEDAANGIRQNIIDRLKYVYAYNFVARLKGNPQAFIPLNAASDDIRVAFKWILALIGSQFIPPTAVIPVLAYPFKANNSSPEIIIFSGDGSRHIDDFARHIEERYKKDEDFRKAIGCLDDGSRIAIAVRCCGDPTAKRGALLTGDSLVGGNTPFIWRSEAQLFNALRNHKPLV